jgi:hypothetical protein
MSSPPGEKKSLWDLAGTRIGVIAALLGLFVALLGLPRTIRDAIGASDSAQASKFELANERAQARAAGPRVDVRYLVLTFDLLRRYQLSGSKQQQADAAGTLTLAFPIVANDVMNQIEDVANTRSCKYQEFPNISVAFLELTNRGRRDATNVVVDADRLTLPKPVRVREAASGGDDYVAKLHAGASATTPVKVRIPRTLGPGDGVRVPLFVSDGVTDSYDRWCALSTVVYLPRTLHYDDPALATTSRTRVRRMQAPLVVGRGAFERG